MKKSSILMGMFLICACFALSLPAQAAPQLEVVGGTTFDFGDVQPNQTLTHEFVFKNTGDSVLTIEQVKGG
ncbi:hypothetical protein U14_03754 [Candidatus Moduliflexus flocculans]|uniref:DUF1573 domain-containing protein n=1 Tax=Candidatus Moduliflexus flocculans TaxID=1499966 RepID=A0A081BQ37_9BACT|nr:hypothetical protein U14_03754 [Candidatus Moduliflexus flocculans]